jgi:hypothetical protein
MRPEIEHYIALAHGSLAWRESEGRDQSSSLNLAILADEKFL